tara:strand:- start:2045 stop:2689 length:645 start_codon:yes stop_codon:yes gene_type:complete
MNELSANVSSLRSRFDRVVGRRDEVVSRIKDTKTTISTLENEEHLCELVAELFRQMIDAEVNAGVQAVENLLTEGLSAVFSDQQISVRSEVKTHRGKVSVDLITTQKQADGSVSEGSTIDAFGGAVTTVQSVLLRLIVVMRRGLRPVLLLDESLPAFDANYVDNMGKFLRLLCERMGVDILLVTHNPALVEASHKAYRIRRTPKGAKFDLVGGK